MGHVISFVYAWSEFCVSYLSSITGFPSEVTGNNTVLVRSGGLGIKSVSSFSSTHFRHSTSRHLDIYHHNLYFAHAHTSSLAGPHPAVVSALSLLAYHLFNIAFALFSTHTDTLFDIQLLSCLFLLLSAWFLVCALYAWWEERGGQSWWRGNGWPRDGAGLCIDIWY